MTGSTSGLIGFQASARPQSSWPVAVRTMTLWLPSAASHWSTIAVRADGAVACDLDLTNEAELRALLGVSSGEASDPGELLWALYRKLGEELLDRLRGAFAFALWDRGEHRLLVATDPYGIRPAVHARSLDVHGDP